MNRPDTTALDVPGAGTATITHTRADDGVHRAEVRLCLVLPGDDQAAVLRLTALTTHLRALIGPARRDRADRRAA